MSISGRYLSAFLLTFSLLLFQSCFPTKTDETQDKPTDMDTVIITEDPDQLPIDIDPNFIVNDNSIDSLFNVLVNRVKSLESIETSDDIFNIDFLSIRKGFATALSDNPKHTKANVGFIVSAICAINTSNNIKKAIDSMESYIEKVDDYYYDDVNVMGGGTELQYANAKRMQPNRSHTLNNSLKKQASTRSLVSDIFNRKGIEGIGYVLLAQSPKIIMAQTQKPSFPTFLTVSFIQKTVEDDIIPRLNEIVSACERLTQNDMSIILTALDEPFELDRGDILLFEAGIKLARAGLGLFTTYNMDIKPLDGSSSMNWIDEFSDMENYSEQQIYRLKNDTLIDLRVINFGQTTGKIADIVQYNLKRPDFLKIRQSNHEWVYNDLKMVPELIKLSLKSMKEETDNQDDDLIAAGEIFKSSADMADISNEMLEEGISPSLASRFVSPEALMDFITEILTKEYTFSETIDGYSVTALMTDRYLLNVFLILMTTLLTAFFQT